MSHGFLFLFFYFYFPLLANCNSIISLNGAWNFYSANRSVSGVGHVPGDIFMDLYNEGKINNPLFGENHLNLKWVSNDDWSYEKKFSVPRSLAKSTFILHCQGLDTIASVSINNKNILYSNNQFISYKINITDNILLGKTNLISIKFKSPVIFAAKMAESYKNIYNHEIPPVCPPFVYHGECHPNFIRKPQYSFSWDWGPSFPTVGIIDDIFIEVIKKPTLHDVSVTTHLINGRWVLDFKIQFVSINSERQEYFIDIPQLGVNEKSYIDHTNFDVKNDLKINHVHHSLSISENVVERWWPNGEGFQKMYNVYISGGAKKIKKKVAFRTVELIQDLVDEKNAEKGRQFYFKINGRPIFLKGSNWIPVSMFHQKAENIETMKFLIDSAAEVGMNVLRVWGGGYYESNEFYAYASQKGILIWQDMMFACALYPTNDEFIKNIETEITQQIDRLKHFPSILIFAGNNENEAAIRGSWWRTTNYTVDQQVQDYRVLYKKIKDIVKAQAPNIPFVMSSPSNGIETDREGYVSKNPYDPRYGDIHFYNEFINLWRDDSYLTPRCATEYGVQSFPLKSSMLKWIDEDQWDYKSEQMFHRQHHPGGIATNLLMIFSHLPIPNGCDSKSLADIYRCPLLDLSKFMSRLAYFSQIHQAIALKMQTFHYRRFRNVTNSEGLGNTMCSMYWQLNDVWAAPTWSTIDFEKKWKLAQYEARRFFSSLSIFLHVDERDFDLKTHIINDKPKNVENLTLTISTYTWIDVFSPILVDKFRIEKIPAGSSIELNNKLQISVTSLSDYFYVGRLYDSNENLLSTDVMLPDFLFEINFELFGKVEIFDVKKISPQVYELTIITDKISPFTLIECTDDSIGWFSDNGFHMIEKLVKVNYFQWKKSSKELSKNSFKVCNLSNCFV